MPTLLCLWVKHACVRVCVFLCLCVRARVCVRKNENENYTVLIPEGNPYYRLKRRTKSLGLKSHLMDYHQKLTYLYGYPLQS